MSIFGIDPGPSRSSWVVWESERVTHRGGDEPNDVVLGRLSLPGGREHLAIEMIAGMGLRVGASVFETAYWVGRFVQAWTPRPYVRIKRHDVKMYLCGTMRSKDADVRHAIISRFGGKDEAIGSIHRPGPLHGITTHMWSALAVALTAEEREKRGNI